MKPPSSVRAVMLLAFVHVALSQRVAPGVPPSQYQPAQQQVPQYQQQVPQQQYQQPPPPQHHPQQPHQQPPPPQHHPQQPHQQPPPQHHPQQPQQQHAPHGHAPHGNPQVLNLENIQEEREHIKEHMDVPIDTSKMSEQELQFHYFKMHDSDNNNKLDGCELIKSLIHWHAGDESARAMYTDDQLETIVDQVLTMMDNNPKDGLIEYHEYINSEVAQNRADDLKANPDMQTKN
uniref:Putative mediator of rna polymerase ii transcription subunit 12-like protein n=2 Tax=Nyssomyia neivai TaxID=330878 RepID=A0A1L8DHK7_9DIPT